MIAGLQLGFLEGDNSKTILGNKFPDECDGTAKLKL